MKKVNALKAIAIAFLAILIVLVTLRNWGVGQELTPGLLTKQLAIGMSRSEMEQRGYRALNCVKVALPEDHESTDPNAVMEVCMLSEPGVGSLFVPQHAVEVKFSRDMKIINIVFNWHYQTKETWEALFPLE